MEPWTIDAAGVDISTLHELPPCRNDVKQFLNDQVGGMKRILVAPKGYGKTLYLKYKARQVGQKYKKSVPIHPPGRGGIEFLQLSLDWKETLASVGRLQADDWSVIWQLVLISKAIQLVDAVNEVDHPILRDLLRRPSDSVADLLSSVLRDPDHFGARVPELLRDARNTFKVKAQDAVIFIDNADEMFASLDVREQFQVRTQDFDSDNSNGDQNGSTVAIEFNKSNPTIWHSTQVGLLLAIREIERNTPLLSVYSSLRAEAVSAANHSHALQAKTHTVEITYNEENLKEIFEWHVRLMSASELVEPESAHPADRLMGSDPIAHRYAKVNGIPLQEEPFGLLLRHTTFSPRDLVVIGGRVARLSVEERRGVDRHQRIRRAIDDGVRELFQYFRQNAIPRWEPRWEEALARIDTPVLSKQECDGLPVDSARRFYSYGLLGISCPTADSGRYTQEFLTQWDPMYAAQNGILPGADYYFLHPWLHDWLRDHNPRFSRECAALIGRNAEYVHPGPLRVAIVRDANMKPALRCGDVLDFPVGQHVPMPVACFFSLLLAAKKQNSVQISSQALNEGYDEFEEIFGRVTKSKKNDRYRPFEDDHHRSHFSSEIEKWFPNLNLASLQAHRKIEMKITDWGTERATLHLDLIDPSRITLEV